MEHSLFSLVENISTKHPPTISDPPWQYHTPTIAAGGPGQWKRADLQVSPPIDTRQTDHNTTSRRKQGHQHTVSEPLHSRTDLDTPRRHASIFSPQHHIDRPSESAVLPYSNHAFLETSRAHISPNHSTADDKLPSLREILKACPNTASQMLSDYPSPDEDLEDLTSLDIALTKKEVYLPVQQRLQALDASTELAGLHASANRIIASRYLRGLDERVYMAHVSDTDSWETVRDDPIFAPIDLSGPAIPFWHLRLRHQKLALENTGWNDFAIGLEAESDLDDQMSLAMSESEGGSPPPRTQLMHLGRGYAKQDGHISPLAISETPKQPTARPFNTCLPAYPDHIRADRFASFGGRFPISHFALSQQPPPNNDRNHVRNAEPAILEVNSSPTRAISGEATSLLQNINRDKSQTVALPSITSSSILPNNTQRQKSALKRSIAHTSSRMQTSQSSTPATVPAITIKLKLPETEPRPKPNSERKSKQAKRATDPRADNTQDASHEERDQQQISSTIETDPKPSQPSPPPSSTATQGTQESSTPSNPRHAASAHPTIHASGRSLRQNPTPSRKRRYSEDEQAQAQAPSLRGRGRGRSRSEHRGRRGAGHKRGS